MPHTHPHALHITCGFAAALCIGAGANRISLSSGGPAAEVVGLLSESASSHPKEVSHVTLIGHAHNTASPYRTDESEAYEVSDCNRPRSLAGEVAAFTDDRLLSALIAVESGGRADAVGDGGKAVGCLQIWPITVADANRILGREEFTLADRLDSDRSRQIFHVITNHYSRGASDEVIARRWNSGPTGDRKACSVGYWDKVRKAMEVQK